jgi:hypothetical protein
VGDDHTVQAADFSSEQLLSQVGAAIDEHAYARTLDQD